MSPLPGGGACWAGGHDPAALVGLKLGHGGSGLGFYQFRNSRLGRMARALRCDQPIACGGLATDPVMTEAEAHEMLRRHDGWGGIEAWIAGHRWQTTPSGWTVTGELQGWCF